MSRPDPDDGLTPAPWPVPRLSGRSGADAEAGDPDSCAPAPAPEKVDVLRWRQGEPPVSTHDHLAGEEPLEIRIDTRPVSITLRTPGHDAELALGFLLSEGLIQSTDQVARIQPHPRNPLGNSIDVQLQPGVSVDVGQLTRHVFASSSCGLCGTASLERVHRHFPPLPRPTGTSMAEDGFPLESGDLLEWPARMQSAQQAFARTGGLHAAALWDVDGALRALREDVGRHNAVDKILGWACAQRLLPLSRCGLLVSGRVSFEIVQKALAARIPLLAAVSAPSSLAVALARASHMTLIGFLRPGRFNVYSAPERIRWPDADPVPAFPLHPPEDGDGQ